MGRPPRPQWHLSTDTWLNDPNGLIHQAGRWHAFYQSNPFGTHWGNMSWGHASSTDLVSWQFHPTAIAAEPGEDIFSGSCVAVPAEIVAAWPHPVETGAASEVLVAVYTSHWHSDSPRAGTQSQSLATSADGGHTWVRYPGNPVLDRTSANFRDPKVFRHRDWWVMVAVEAEHQQVVLYDSGDLIDWTLRSTFGPVHSTGGAWECPDLLRLPVEGTDEFAWVLLVSINPGGISGGSGMQYFVGDFDGTEFRPHRLSDSDDPRTYDWLDLGRDHYAAVSFHAAPAGRCVLLGWTGNWDYAHEAAALGRRSLLSMPRDASLVRRDGRLVVRQRPVPEVLDVHPAERVSLAPGERFEVEGLTVAFDGGRLSVTRPDADGLPRFGGTVWGELDAARADLEVWVDAGIVEISADDGLLWFSHLTPC